MTLLTPLAPWNRRRNINTIRRGRSQVGRRAKRESGIRFRRRSPRTNTVKRRFVSRRATLQRSLWMRSGSRTRGDDLYRMEEKRVPRIGSEASAQRKRLIEELPVRIVLGRELPENPAWDTSLGVVKETSRLELDNKEW